MVKRDEPTEKRLYLIESKLELGQEACRFCERGCQLCRNTRKWVRAVNVLSDVYEECLCKVEDIPRTERRGWFKIAQELQLSNDMLVVARALGLRPGSVNDPDWCRELADRIADCLGDEYT